MRAGVPTLAYRRIAEMGRPFSSSTVSMCRLARRSGPFELYRDDVTKPNAALGVDILVVSAFPDDYEPTPGSLIGALADAGLPVDDLAVDRAVDVRTNHS